MHKTIVILLLCQCGLFTNTYNKIVPKNDYAFVVNFYLRWYNMKGWSVHICKKASFLSFYSFLVKFSRWHRGSGRVKLTDCHKVEWGEKCNYASDIYWMAPCLICYFPVILFYIGRKRLAMRILAIILSLKSKLSGKFQRSTAIVESIEILK